MLERTAASDYYFLGRPEDMAGISGEEKIETRSENAGVVNTYSRAIKKNNSGNEVENEGAKTRNYPIFCRKESLHRTGHSAPPAAKQLLSSHPKECTPQRKLDVSREC